MLRLSGRLPFMENNQAETEARIQAAKFDLSKLYQNVSQSASLFLKKILCSYPWCVLSLLPILFTWLLAEESLVNVRGLTDLHVCVLLYSRARPSIKDCFNNSWLQDAYLMRLRRQTLTFTTTRLKEFVSQQQHIRAQVATKHKVLLRSYSAQTPTTPTTPTMPTIPTTTASITSIPSTPVTQWARLGFDGAMLPKGRGSQNKWTKRHGHVMDWDHAEPWLDHKSVCVNPSGTASETLLFRNRFKHTHSVISIKKLKHIIYGLLAVDSKALSSISYGQHAQCCCVHCSAPSSAHKQPCHTHVLPCYDPCSFFQHLSKIRQHEHVQLHLLNIL